MQFNCKKGLGASHSAHMADFFKSCVREASLIESISDCLADRATSTLHQRGIVWNDAKKVADRIASGCFLLMIYGRLRFSDLQRTSKLVIDAVRRCR